MLSVLTGMREQFGMPSYAASVGSSQTPYLPQVIQSVPSLNFFLIWASWELLFQFLFAD